MMNYRALFALLIGLGALLAPAEAHAVEAVVYVIAAIGAAIGGTAGAFLIMNAVAVAWAVLIAATVGMAAYQKRKAEARARNAYNAALRDRNIMIRGATEPRELVLGRVRKSGTLVFWGSTGEHKEYLYMVIAVAAHEIDAIEQVYFNDEPVTIDPATSLVTSDPWTKKTTSVGGHAYVDFSTAGSYTLPEDPYGGSVVAGWYYWGNGSEDNGSFVQVSVTVTGRVVSWAAQPAAYWGNGAPTGTIYFTYTKSVPKAAVWWHLGRDDQAADATLMEEFPGRWTAEHRLRGIAYVVVNMVYSQDVFTTGVPNVSVVMRGAKVHDPRTGQTAWSDNPALLMRHYALHPLGGNLPLACVAGGDASIIAAANVCDQSVAHAYTNATTGASSNVTRKLYTAGLVARSGTRPKDAMDELCEAMAGKWTFANNRLRVKAGHYTPPVLALGDGDFSAAAAVRVTPRRPREQLVNTITGVFCDSAKDWQVVDFARVVAAPYVAQDGGELPLEVELSGVTNDMQAQHVSAVMIRDARQALTVVAAFKLSAYPVEVFDTVALTSSRYGWNAKDFEVMSRQWTVDGGVQLTLKETAPGIYALGTDFSRLDLAPNTDLPDPRAVPRVTGLVADSASVTNSDGSRVARVRVTWDAVPSALVIQSGTVEVQYIELPEPGQELALDSDAWPSVTVPGESVAATIAGVRAGAPYLFRARAVSTLGVRGQWSQIDFHQVVPLDPITTGEIGQGEVTVVAQATDTATYGTFKTAAAPVTVTIPPGGCDVLVQVEATLTATNASAIDNYFMVMFSIAHNNATWGGGGFGKRYVKAGTNESVRLAAEWLFPLMSAGQRTFACFYTEHNNCPVPTQMGDFTTKVEVIKR